MNKKFLSILSEYIPTSKTGTQFESELRKMNISRQELAHLFGVPVNTIARKFNKNSQHYKKKQKKVIEEWALYGIKCAINDIEKRAEEVKKRKVEEAKQLVTYAKGELTNRDIIMAEKRVDILQAIEVYGANIKKISKSVNLHPTTILKHILSDEELKNEFEIRGEFDILDQMKILKDIAKNKESSDKDRISAAKEVIKNTKSKLLDKNNENFNNKPIGPNNFFIKQFPKKNKVKEITPTRDNIIEDEEGNEFVIIDNDEHDKKI